MLEEDLPKLEYGDSVSVTYKERNSKGALLGIRDDWGYFLKCTNGILELCHYDPKSFSQLEDASEGSEDMPDDITEEEAKEKESLLLSHTSYYPLEDIIDMGEME